MSRPVLLLTGASGFIGRQALPALLHRGFEVHALSRAGVGPEHEGAHWRRADLLDASARRDLIAELRPTHLVHLAWTVEPGKFWTAPENADWLEASADLLALFAAAGGRRALLAGTCAEYDWRRDLGRPWREDDTCAPQTPYGQAKHALHRRAAVIAAQTGLSLAWARLFMIFGPHEDSRRLVPTICRALIAERQANLTSGRQIRDFLDTRDIGEALATLVEGSVEGPVNVASGEARSLASIALELAGFAGRPELVRLGALPDRAGEPPVLVADISRLREEVGFQPAASLSDRLAQCLDWQRLNDPHRSG
jgi:nucleoside-diphosphate-sugar epimerase